MANKVLFRARLSSTGIEIIGGDFKRVYESAMREAKGDVYTGFDSVIIELEKGFDSQPGYLNVRSILSYDFICSEYVGTISMTPYGYAVYSSCGSCYVPCDIRRKVGEQ